MSLGFNTDLKTRRASKEIKIYDTVIPKGIAVTMNVSVNFSECHFPTRVVLGADFLAMYSSSWNILLLEVTESTILTPNVKQIQGVNHDPEHYGEDALRSNPRRFLGDNTPIPHMQVWGCHKCFPQGVDVLASPGCRRSLERVSMSRTESLFKLTVILYTRRIN